MRKGKSKKCSSAFKGWESNKRGNPREGRKRASDSIVVEKRGRDPAKGSGYS